MFSSNVRKFVVYLGVIFSAAVLAAQESKPPAPTGTYKLDFTLSEMQDGKRTNTRNYTLLIRTMEKGTIKVGSRVPISVGNSKEGGNQIQYLDVGTNLDCRVGQELDSGIELTTDIDANSLVSEQPGDNRTGDPVIGQVRYKMDNIVPLGKQTVLGSADAVDGRRRLQVEVTASKVR